MTRRNSLCTVLLVNTIVGGEGLADTKAIEALLLQFNSSIASNDHPRTVGLFTPNGTYQAGNEKALPVAQALRQLAPKRLPWDERMPLAISIQKITFPRNSTAVVEAIQRDSSPMLDTRAWSCTFILVRSGSGWKISAYRESLPGRQFPPVDNATVKK